MLSDLHLLTLAITVPFVWFLSLGTVAYLMGLPMQTKANTWKGIAASEWVMALIFGVKGHLVGEYVSPLPMWHQVGYTVVFAILSGTAVFAIFVAVDLWDYSQPVIEPPEDA